MNRNAASGARTVWLHAGESLRLSFETATAATYGLTLRYSNDNTDQGPFETVNLSLDGASTGSFVALDTRSDGFGWRFFVDSPVFGPLQVAAGRHELLVTVSGGDGLGWELDKATFSLQWRAAVTQTGARSAEGHSA